VFVAGSEVGDENDDDESDDEGEEEDEGSDSDVDSEVLEDYVQVGFLFSSSPSLPPCRAISRGTLQNTRGTGLQQYARVLKGLVSNTEQNQDLSPAENTEEQEYSPEAKVKPAKRQRAVPPAAVASSPEEEGMPSSSSSFLSFISFLACALLLFSSFRSGHPCSRVTFLRHLSCCCLALTQTSAAHRGLGFRNSSSSGSDSESDSSDSVADPEAAPKTVSDKQADVSEDSESDSDEGEKEQDDDGDELEEDVTPLVRLTHEERLARHLQALKRMPLLYSVSSTFSLLPT
jgi:hypothetical protein